MADAGSSIFNKKAAEKLRSPDDLDKYVRISNPSVWAVLAACVILLAGLLAWGVFGTVTTSVSSTGVNIDGEVMCFVKAEDASKIKVGNEAVVDGKTMTVSSVASVPISRNEAGSVLVSDYLINTIVVGDWVYLVVFEGDSTGIPYAVPLSTSITIERIAPISLVLGDVKR